MRNPGKYGILFCMCRPDSKTNVSVTEDMVMGKKFAKLLGMECLYLLGAILAAMLGNMIQYIGKEYIGEHSSFIFRGDVYKYNMYAYIAGIAVFVEFILLCHKLLVKKFAGNISDLHPAFKAVYILVTPLFGVLMVLGLLSELYIFLESGDALSPEILFVVTVAGWPVITVVYMIIVIALNWKKKGGIERSAGGKITEKR